MSRCYKVAAQIEEVRDSSVDTDESFRLQHGLETSHPPLSQPGRLMRQLSAIVRVPTGVVDRVRQPPTMGHRITAQLARHDRPGLTTMAGKQASEEALGGRRISPLLEQHVDDVTVLVDRSPQVPSCVMRTPRRATTIVGVNGDGFPAYVTENGQGLTSGTYAIGTIIVDYFVTGFQLPTDWHDSFRMCLDTVAAGGKQASE